MYTLLCKDIIYIYISKLNNIYIYALLCKAVPINERTLLHDGKVVDGILKFCAALTQYFFSVCEVVPMQSIVYSIME